MEYRDLIRFFGGLLVVSFAGPPLAAFLIFVRDIPSAWFTLEVIGLYYLCAGIAWLLLAFSATVIYALVADYRLKRGHS